MTELTNLYDHLTASVGQFGDRPMMVCDGHSITYGEVQAAAADLAESLSRTGVSPGDRVAVFLPNHVDVPVCLFAIAKLKAVAVPISTRFKAREITEIVDDAGLSAIITASESIGPLDLLQRLRSTLGFDEPARDVRGQWSRHEVTQTLTVVVRDFIAPPPELAAAAGEAGIVLYTSGTTARSKGCLLRSNQMLANSAAAAERYGLRGDDVFWNPLPLFHIGGVMHLLALTHLGATCVTAAHFDAATALRLMQQHKVTFAYPAFPTLTERLVGAGGIPVTAPFRPRALMTLGSPEFMTQTQAAFPGTSVIAAYGSTELSGTVVSPQVDDPVEIRLRTCGRPFPGVRVSIVEPGTWNALDNGQFGEITVSGPCVFGGYLNSADLNEQTIVDGWLRTGDSGSVDDDGNLHYNGRLKDMFKVGGESVSPEEIAGVLVEHPDVQMAVVVGVPDEDYGEVAAAFVEVSTTVSAELLTEWCADQLASYKVPRHVRFVEEWPMSDTKIRVADLRAALVAEMASRPDVLREFSPRSPSTS